MVLPKLFTWRKAVKVSGAMLLLASVCVFPDHGKDPLTVCITVWQAKESIALFHTHAHTHTHSGNHSSTLSSLLTQLITHTSKLR